MGDEPGTLASLKGRGWGVQGFSGINAFLEPRFGWSMPGAASLLQLLLSSNFLSRRKEIALYYVLIMCDIFIDIIILTQQLSKLRLKEVTLVT